ncbi:urea carboxylase [Thozetella sp. PMI_491]|nr:urea carboxylase [Thozetella sp. PMI_491]
MGPPCLQAIKKVLIANRGEIAVRCIRACQVVGIKSVTIYTGSDAASLHVTQADESVLLDGNGTAGYLNIDDILQKCEQCSVDAVIPGYGFLSENVEFCKRVTDAGLVFVGPSWQSIAEMGLKHRAREVAIHANVPTVPGSDLLDSESVALAEADRLKYPVMLKATGGGGGMGLQICHAPADISAAFALVRSRGEKLFKNSGVLLEKYYPRSRHIEIQVFGNGEETIHFGERECSVQRRHQKVIEECPSPFVEARPRLREALTECATRYASALNYKSAGTVEFLVDDETGNFFFLEMNTRLQVEHGITEMCYGVDLVVLMLWQADMEKAGKGGIPSNELRPMQRSQPDGAAIEVRIYAEDPYRNFAPSPGVFQEVRWPEKHGVRIDTWIRSGQDITLHYDPLLAKAMVHAPTREKAISEMVATCSGGILLTGPATNLDFAKAILTSDTFIKGSALTSFLDTEFSYRPCGIDIISAGYFSMIQDFPARSSIGYGVPKSGPMDSFSSRIANILVSNTQGKELIESTLLGPEILFTAAAVVAVCGADAPVTIDGNPRPMWSTLVLQAGQVLKVGEPTRGGCRTYIAVRGGFPGVPLFLGSKSTTPSLHFGGHQGRTLRTGDFLRLEEATSAWAAEAYEYRLPAAPIPHLPINEIYVLQGPHDSKDIMTAEDREMLYSTEWKVGHNSSRTGVRLLGPVPRWARKDGGEAGSHPSNYLDYGYPSPGGMNWGGDSPCIFSVDSPNFGGLVCSSTVISAELWKLGQLKPGDSFRLTPVSLKSALHLKRHLEQHVSEIADAVKGRLSEVALGIWSLPRCEINPTAAILNITEPSPEDILRPKVTYRQGGDSFLLLEFGEQTTNVAIIARIRLLLERLRLQPDIKLLLTPHVGSITIEYDPLEISQDQLLRRVSCIESQIEASIDISIPCRELRLPLVMDHPDFAQCIQRYMETVRNKAAYLPDNLEYLRKCNGLESRRCVFDMMINTEFIVAAVGFLCGAPILFPLSPKRIMCQKYNPTRVSTPGGTIGIGGSILSGYSIEQPGGYMMVARTLEMWDRFGTKPGFRPDKPWLFEPLDKVTFYEVSIDEYDALAASFAAGTYQWQISKSSFNVRQAYDLFQRAQGDPDVLDYKKRQKEWMEMQAEIERVLYSEWESESSRQDSVKDIHPTGDPDELDCITISSPMVANLWKVNVKPGDILREGQIVAVLEAMKMEVNILAPSGSEGSQVHAVLRKPQSIISTGDVLITAILS